MVFFEKLIIYLLVFFFSYTCFHKIYNIEAFQFNIARTAVFPEQYISIVSYLVIGLELLVISLLLFIKRTGLLVFIGVMGLFTIYIIWLYVMGKYEVCGCGGILNGLAFKYHLSINLLMMILGYIALKTLNLKNPGNENS